MEGSFTPPSSDTEACKYGYNGIEYVDNLDLGVNFATFRTLDPALGRWSGMACTDWMQREERGGSDGGEFLWIESL